MANKQINWMADDEYAAMVELVRHGKVTPLVDVIASRLADCEKSTQKLWKLCGP